MQRVGTTTPWQRPFDRASLRLTALRMVQRLLAAMALLVAVGGAVTLVAPGLHAVRVPGAGQAGPIEDLLLLIAGATLLVAGAVAWIGRPGHGLALLGLFAAATWFSIELASSSGVLRDARSLGRILSPLLIPLLVHVPIRALGADRRGRGLDVLLAALYASVVVASAGHALTYDPFFDVDCTPVCSRGDNVVMVHQDARLARWSESVGLVASLAGSLGLVGWSLVSLVRRGHDVRRAPQLVLAAAASTGAAMAWWTGTRLVKDAALLSEGALVAPALATATAVALLGASVTALVADEMRRAAAIRRLVEHDADLDPRSLDREIGAAARLAVDNERLDATIRARLRELQASRSRVVEAGDAARGQLERDLHDGAQQRLLAVSYECRLARAAVTAGQATEAVRTSLEAIVYEIDTALAELRELAHGIHPVVLSEDSLAGALWGLADEARMPLRLVGEVGRCGPASELAAYRAVVEAISRAESAGADVLEIETQSTAGRLLVSIRGQGIVGGGSWQRTEDRVGAAGGRISLGVGEDGVGELRVELPCA